MKKILNLIAELCPNGVIHLPLRAVVLENSGGGTPSRAVERYWGGDIPWASVGDVNACQIRISESRQSITHEGLANSSTRVIPRGSVIVAVKINPGAMRVVEAPLAINQDIRALRLDEKIDPYFLTYFFKTLRVIGDGSIVKGITNSTLEKIVVPVPPIEVQQEIVRILDTFTEIEAELEAELEARKKQYEHYRKNLLSFSEREVRWAPMAEFCRRNKGTSITADKMKSLHKDGGEIRIFAAGSTQVLVNRSDIPQKDIVEKPGIVIKSRGYIGFEFCDTPFSHKSELWSYCVDETQALPRFVMHFLETQASRLQALARSKSVKLPQLAVADTDKLEIPLPTLQQQKSICELLDRFEILTRDLVAGLPGEIGARRKQYEHYRDKLLTFKEFAA